jgi:hypothetical protein
MSARWLIYAWWFSFGVNEAILRGEYIGLGWGCLAGGNTATETFLALIDVSLNKLTRWLSADSFLAPIRNLFETFGPLNGELKLAVDGLRL